MFGVVIKELKFTELLSTTDCISWADKPPGKYRPTKINAAINPKAINA